jgi:hypothetical protein
MMIAPWTRSCEKLPYGVVITHKIDRSAVAGRIPRVERDAESLVDGRCEVERLHGRIDNEGANPVRGADDHPSLEATAAV